MNDLQFKLDNLQQDCQKKFEQKQEDFLKQMRNFMQNFHDGPPIPPPGEDRNMRRPRIQSSRAPKTSNLFQSKNHHKILTFVSSLERNVVALNSKLLLINSNSQRLDKKEQEVKNVVEQPAEPRNRKPEHLLSMGYEHLNITPETESDEVTESISENSLVCDNHSDTFFNSKIDDDILDYDNDFEDIEYIEALLFDPEIVSIEEENSVEAENDSDKSLLDNFSPEFETFYDHSEETRSGNTTHANYSLLEYDSFCFEIEPDQERLINLVKNDILDNSMNDPLLEEVDLFLSDNSIPPGEEIPVVMNDKDKFDNDDCSYFMFIIFAKEFSLFSAENEDTIFDPDHNDLSFKGGCSVEELSEYINSPSWNYPTFYDNDEEHSVQYKEYLEKSPDAITPILPTEEPEYSLSMGYEHLNTTSKTKLDEVTESSAKNLVPIPSEYEVTSDDESEYDMPIKDDSSPAFTTFSNPLFDDNDDFTSSDDESLPDEDVSTEEFKVYSNPLFDDEEINSDKLDPHCFNAESDLIESLLNRYTLIDSSPKFDFLLKEFSDELAHINPVLPEIKKADFDLEEEIRFVENLLYDNSSPRLPEELNAEIADTIVESLSPSTIPVEDNDSLMDEINLFLATDELLPPRIESDSYDSEGDIYFLEELLVDDSISIPENELFDFDHDNPLFPQPPPNHRMLSLILSPIQEK
uniref:Reverse transcriptase domain-containing protein n=1 Tax=Tanacetum cinerariifolium TaxID=118510 RepID=A0A6L2J9L4_TANCI|nr:hypothetical protein [Tanacetum cinerariifolium]